MRARPEHALYGDWRLVLVLLAPAVALLGTFVVWPALRALSVSLYAWSGFSPADAFVGLDNYRALWEDTRLWQSLRNTLYYAVVGGVGHFAFAFLFASALTHPRVRGKKLFQTLLVFPSFISVAGVAILWSLLYDPRAGLINRLLEALGLAPVIWLDAEHGLDAVILCSIWAGVGGHMLILLAGIRRIPPAYLDAARLDGAGEWRVFWHVTLPMLREVTHAALALWVIGAMQVFGLVQALRGPSLPLHIETVATYQYAISFNARDNLYMMGRGAAMAVVLVVLIVVLLIAVRWIFRRSELEY